MTDKNAKTLIVTNISLVVATAGLAVTILVASGRVVAAYATVSSEHQRIFQILDRRCP